MEALEEKLLDGQRGRPEGARGGSSSKIGEEMKKAELTQARRARRSPTPSSTRRATRCTTLAKKMRERKGAPGRQGPARADARGPQEGRPSRPRSAQQDARAATRGAGRRHPQAQGEDGRRRHATRSRACSRRSSASSSASIASDAAEERGPPARSPRPRARAGRRGSDEGPGRDARRISIRAPKTSTGCSEQRDDPGGEGGAQAEARRSCAS